MLFIPTASTGWKKNPVELYLSSLGSRRSSITMQNCIKNIARVLGHENYELIELVKTEDKPLDIDQKKPNCKKLFRCNSESLSQCI